MRCEDNERRALLEFKAGVIDEYGMLSSWGMNSNECCSWRGIRCSNRTGHVIVVNLQYSLFSGKVSPSLSELKQLKYLNLSCNFFDGEIPHQLGNLTNLRSLDLGFNNFNGKIPPQPGNLTNLRSLNLGYADGLTVKNLDLVSRLHFLTHLDLTGVNLSSCNDWLNQIYKLSSLTHLHLTECSLPDQFLPSNNTSISALKSLLVVDLSGNFFISPRSYNWIFTVTTTLVSLDLSTTSLPRSEIPEAIWRMTSLESLSLYDCKLEGTLPDSFMNLTRLATLDLSGNSLNGSLSEFLHPLAIKEKNSSQVLNLQGNQLSGSLPDYFPRFSSLREMLISDNKLNGPFPDNFWQLSSSLVYLDLSNNQLTGPLPNLTLFSSLVRLSLNDNKLEGRVPEAYLSHLSKLSYLDLSSNSLSFNFSFDWFPPFKLDEILFRNCTLGPHFPNWIKSQHNISKIDISYAGVLPNISLAFPDIDWIDLSYNLLQGTIPPLPEHMIFLDLSHNMFTGSLSFICTTLATLLYLDLSDNKLTGELPADCFINYSLIVLNLASNDFSGNIPTSIGTLELQSLLLRNNSFTGQIPLSLMNQTGLELLDLSENKLNGEVLTWIGTYLTSLIVLSLRMNEFSGSIPPQICHLRNARVLDLSQNKLTGSIPHCINNFTSLVEKVDVGYVFRFAFSNVYGYSGYLYPNALVQWKRVASEYKTTLEYLKLIDFSGNRLVGKIPEEFASLKELISLNLSSNRLTGNIIRKIGQMENLESLDLSRNHLSGEIPSSLASLTLLSVLDLSNNNLTGKIPSSTQLQSFEPSDYAGNEHLCGPPLSSKCREVISLPTGQDDKGEIDEEDDVEFPKFWLYVSVVLGFGTGFWGFLGPLILRRSWRHAYYKWFGNIKDRICVTAVLHMTRLQRKF